MACPSPWQVKHWTELAMVGSGLCPTPKRIQAHHGQDDRWRAEDSYSPAQSPSKAEPACRCQRGKAHGASGMAPACGWGEAWFISLVWEGVLCQGTMPDRASQRLKAGNSPELISYHLILKGHNCQICLRRANAGHLPPCPALPPEAPVPGHEHLQRGGSG